MINKAEGRHPLHTAQAVRQCSRTQARGRMPLSNGVVSIVRLDAVAPVFPPRGVDNPVTATTQDALTKEQIQEGQSPAVTRILDVTAIYHNALFFAIPSTAPITFHLGDVQDMFSASNTLTYNRCHQ